MKTFDLPLWADVVFYSLTTGIVSLCILRYLQMPLSLAFVVSVLFALAVGGLVFLFSSRSHRKRRLSKKQLEDMNALMLHLALEREDRVRSLALDALKADEREVHATRDCMTLDGKFCEFLFTMQPLSADAVASLLREYGEEKFTLFCNQLSPEAEGLLASFGITVTCGKDFYQLLERTETYPETLICGNIPRQTVKTRAKRAFSKRNARPFFVSGILLLLMSLYAVFPTYYLITGIILMATSVLVRLFGATA